MQNNEKERNLINTKFGQLLFVEGEREADGSSRKDTNVYTLDGKYLVNLKAYWWDKQGILAELDKGRIEDIIYDKLESHTQTVADKMESMLESIRRMDDDELTKEGKTLLEHIKDKSKK